MAIRGDSYGSAAEVVAFTRHLLDGQSTFNSTTRPTVTEVEKFIDRSSGLLNSAIWDVGFSPSNVRGNSTAKLACDDWVVTNTAKYVEMTQRGVGYSENEGSRIASFTNMQKKALEFAKNNSRAWARLGISRTHKPSDGLQFTGLDAQSERTDPDDTTLEQPIFKRGQWSSTDRWTEEDERNQ